MKLAPTEIGTLIEGTGTVDVDREKQKEETKTIYIERALTAILRIEALDANHRNPAITNLISRVRGATSLEALSRINLLEAFGVLNHSLTESNNIEIHIAFLRLATTIFDAAYEISNTTEHKPETPELASAREQFKIVLETNNTLKGTIPYSDRIIGSHIQPNPNHSLQGARESIRVMANGAMESIAA